MRLTSRLALLLTLAAPGLMAGGCGKGPEASAPPAKTAQSGLAKQLTAMTPQQRTQYFHDHPEAMAVLSGNAIPKQ